MDSTVRYLRDFGVAVMAREAVFGRLVGGGGGVSSRSR